MKLLHQTDQHPGTRTRTKVVLGTESEDERTGKRFTETLFCDFKTNTLLDFAYFLATPKKPFMTQFHNGNDTLCPLVIIDQCGRVFWCQHDSHQSDLLPPEEAWAIITERDDRRRCRNCGDHSEPKRILRGQVHCTDNAACEHRFEDRKASDPKFARAVQYRSTETDETGEVVPAKAKKVRAAKEVKPPRSCECGCGEMTKGGRFRPGHDAKHHARLKKEAADAVLANAS